MNVADAIAQLSHHDEATRDRALALLAADKRAAIPALLAALKSPTPPTSFPRLVLLLAAFGAKEAVPVLVDRLDRGTLGIDERAVVARALGELVDARHRGDARLRRHAMALAREPFAPTRASVVPLLSVLGDGDALDALRTLAVTDADAEVRRHAAEALALAEARGGPPPRSPPAPSETAALPPGAMAVDFAALMTSAPSESMPVPPGLEGGMVFDIEAMVHAQKTAPPPSTLDPRAALIARLRDTRWAERAKAVDEVVAHGKEMIPLLVEHLGHDVPARMGICLALARLRAPEAAGALLMVATAEATTQAERDVQAVALKALANCLTGTEEGVSAPLLPLLKSPDPFVRAGAVLCLGRLADRVGPRAATLLLAHDSHDEVKKAAAVALSESVREDDGDLVPAWLGILGEIPRPPAEGQEAILVAFTRVELSDAAWRVRVRHRVRPLVFGFTASQRRLAITVLERCYADDDPPPVWVVDDVFSRLQDASPEVRLVAASFVARFLEPGFTDAVARLEDALDRQERGVSLLCLEALRRHDTPLARAALEAVASSEPDPELRARAAALLQGFSPSSSEWSAAAVPPPSTPAPSPATAAANPQPEAQRARPRRVRVAGTASDAVEAKEPPTDPERASPAPSPDAPERDTRQG